MSQIGRKACVALVVVVILLLANSVSFFRNFLYLGQTETEFRAALLGSQEVAIVAIILFALVSVFTFRASAFKIWVGTLFVTTSATIYFVINYGVRINSFILKNVSETHKEEIAEFLDINFLLYLGAGIGAALLFYNLGKLPMVHRVPALKGWPWDQGQPLAYRHETREWLRYMAIMGTLVLAFLAIIRFSDVQIDKFVAKGVKDFSPINLVLGSLSYARKSIRGRSKKIRDISRQFVRLDNPGSKPLTIVLVLGESARGDRFSLNGYGRKTNPKLSRIKNLFSFHDASSCDTSTVVAVPCILSRRLQADFSLPLRETSLIGILRHLGFATFWYSLQRNSFPIEQQCQEAEICRDVLPLGYGVPNQVNYDTDLLAYLDKVLEFSGNQNILVVLHTMGSHTSYFTRTPKDMAKFTPVCSKSAYACEKKRLDNTYDNTIFFTDHFLASVIKRLSGRNAFMVYTSDHGESLGEVNIWGRSYGHSRPFLIAPKAQIHVPLIFWASDAFLQSSQTQIPQAISRHLDQPVSHDNMFHSVLDCAGVRSRLIIEKLSFCR